MPNYKPFILVVAGAAILSQHASAAPARWDAISPPPSWSAMQQQQQQQQQHTRQSHSLKLSRRSDGIAFRHTLTCEKKGDGIFFLTAAGNDACVKHAGLLNDMLAECVDVVPSLAHAAVTCPKSASSGYLLSATPCADTLDAVVVALAASERFGDTASDADDDRHRHGESGDGSAADASFASYYADRAEPEAALERTPGLVDGLHYQCLAFFGSLILHGTDFDTCSAEAKRIGEMLEDFAAGTVAECTHTTLTTNPTTTTTTSATTTPTTSPVTGTLKCIPSGRSGEAFIAADSDRCARQADVLGDVLEVCQENGVGKVRHTNLNFNCDGTGSSVAVLSTGGVCSSVIKTVNSLVQQHDGGAEGSLYCRRGSRKMRVAEEECDAVAERLSNAIDAVLQSPDSFDCGTTTPTTTPTTITATTTTSTDTGTSLTTLSTTTLTTTTSTTSTTVLGPALRCRELRGQLLIVADDADRCPVQLEHVDDMLDVCRQVVPPPPPPGSSRTDGGEAEVDFTAIDLSCFTRAATSFAVLAYDEASCPKKVHQLNNLLQYHDGGHGFSQSSSFMCTFDGLLTVAAGSEGVDSSSSSSKLEACTETIGRLLAATAANVAGDFSCIPPTTTTDTTTTSGTSSTTTATATTTTATDTTITGTTITTTTSATETSTSTTTTTQSTTTATSTTTSTTTTTTATTATATTLTDTTTTRTGTTTTTIDLSCPAKCCSYFDGCNACTCDGGFRTSCTERVCGESLSPAFCLQECPDTTTTTTATTTTTTTTTTAVTTSTTTPAPTTLVGGATNLLEGKGTVCSDGSLSSGVEVNSAPAFGATFSLTLEVKLVPQRSGYVFARSNAAGFRHVSLYVRSKNRGIIMYYKAQGSTQQKLARFNFDDLGDGQTHTLTLQVDGGGGGNSNSNSAGASVSLSLDGSVVGTESLDGPIDDCGAPSSTECITHIGRRAGGFPMSGCVAFAAFTAGSGGGDESVDVFDLLHTSNHVGASGAGLSQPRCFDKSTPAIRLRKFPTASPLDEMTITTTFSISNPNAYGYLYSKGGSKSRRDFAVYLRKSDHRLVLYYRTVGNQAQQKRTLFTDTILQDTVFPSALDKPAAVTPGPTYTLTLVISGKKVLVLLTAKSSSGTAKAQFRVTLPNVIDDCGGASDDDCSFHVGERLGGYKLNDGCLLAATVQ